MSDVPLPSNQDASYSDLLEMEAETLSHQDISVQVVAPPSEEGEGEADVEVQEVTEDSDDELEVVPAPGEGGSETEADLMAQEDVQTAATTEQDASANAVPPPRPRVQNPPPFEPIPEHRRSFKQMVCLAGMPRAGGTLLTAILSENPKIHTEGHSPLCQLMWDTYLSYQDKCNREFASNGKDRMLPQIIGQMPHAYYQNVPPGTEVVVDRCRSWTHEFNVNMLRGSVDPNMKIIVMDRPIHDVVRSYARMLANTPMGGSLDKVLPQLLQPDCEPILRAWTGVQWAKAVAKEVPGLFLIVSYDELVSEPAKTLEKIYAFCGWEPFEHHFDQVKMRHPENANVHGLPEQFEVRPQVAKRANQVVLPEEVVKILQNYTTK
jgi:sulfotransferase